MRVVIGVVAGLTACSQSPAPVRAPAPPDTGDPRIGHWDDRFRLPGLEQSPFDGQDPVADALAVLPDRSIVVGGIFDRAMGVPVQNVARFDGASWHAMGSGLSHVRGLAVDDAGAVWALADAFPMMDVVVRWDGVAWTSMGQVLDLGLGIAAVDGGVAVFGNAGLAVWDGTGWTSLGLSDDSRIEGLARVADGFCVAGWVGVPAQGLADRRGLACWNGSTWTELGDELGQSQARPLVQGPDGTWWIGSGVWADGASGTTYGVGFLARDGTWQPLDGGLQGPDAVFPATSAAAIAFDTTGGVIVGGNFATVGPDHRSAPGLARWSPQDGWQAFHPATWPYDGGIHAIATDGDRIHLAGLFNSIGSTSATGVATIEADGTVTTWVGAASALGVNGGVADIVASGDSIVVPGRITAGSVVTAPLASFDQSWHRMVDPPADDQIVDAAARSDGSLVLSGADLYAWNGASWDTLVIANTLPSQIFIDTDDAIYYGIAGFGSRTEIRRSDDSGDVSLGTVPGIVLAFTTFDDHLIAATRDDVGDSRVLTLADGRWTAIPGAPSGIIDATWSPAFGLVVANAESVTAWNGVAWNVITTAPPQRPIAAIAVSTSGVFIATWSLDGPTTAALEYADDSGLRRLGALGDGQPYKLVPTRDGVYVATSVSGRSQFGFFVYD